MLSAIDVPRHPGDVPLTFVTTDDGVAAFADAAGAAVRAAVDTETVYRAGDGDAPGALRVISAAFRDGAGIETAWVLDVRDLTPSVVAPVLDGLAADAWNAPFDDGVLDRHVFTPAGLGPSHGVRWWDAQLADALLHVGLRSWFHGLAWATEHHLGIVADGKGSVQLSFEAEVPLTGDQVAYAAADAVETLWVGDALRACLAAEGLTTVADLEMGALPLLAQAERRGLHLDRAGCARALADTRAQLATSRSRLAELTSGGQGNLFSPEVEPTWNPASMAAVRSALNRWAGAEVGAAFERAEGHRRALSDEDKVDDRLLAGIGGPLATALLAYRADQDLIAATERLLSQLRPDGRLHPRYLQVVGTSSGAPSSRGPDVATLVPALRAHIRPQGAGRTFLRVRLVRPPAAEPAVGPAADPIGEVRPGPTVGPVDWDATLLLFDELGPLRSFRRGFRDQRRRWPSHPEILAARPETPLWVLDHDEAFVLGEGGATLLWEARSPAGRRRRYALRTPDVLRRAAAALGRSGDPAVLAVWRSVVGEVPLPLPLVSTDGAPHQVEDPVDAAERGAAPLGLMRCRTLLGQVRDRWPERARAELDAAAAQAATRLAPSLERAPAELAAADVLAGLAAALWRVLREEVHAGVDRHGSGDGSAPSVPVAVTIDGVVLECDRRRLAGLTARVEVAVAAELTRADPGAAFAVEITAGDDLAWPLPEA